MQTPINWIKYEGRADHLEEGDYLVYGLPVDEGKTGPKKLRVGFLFASKKWHGIGSFIIEYIAPLSEIERGIEEGVNKQK